METHHGPFVSQPPHSPVTDATRAGLPGFHSCSPPTGPRPGWASPLRSQAEDQPDSQHPPNPAKRPGAGLVPKEHMRD